MKKLLYFLPAVVVIALAILIYSPVRATTPGTPSRSDMPGIYNTTSTDLNLRDGYGSALAVNQYGQLKVSTSSSFTVASITATTGTFSNLTVTVLVSSTGSITIHGTDATNPFVITSSTGNPMLTVLSNGFVGINTTTPISYLTIQGSGVTSSTASFGVYNASSSLGLRILDDGSMVVDSGSVYHDGTGKVTYINSLETGNFSFPDDAGLVAWADLINSSSAANTALGYSANLNGVGVGGPLTYSSGVGTSYNNMWMWGDLNAATSTVLAVSSTLRTYYFPAVTSTYTFLQKIVYITTSTPINHGAWSSLVEVTVTSTGAYVTGQVSTLINNTSSTIGYSYTQSGNTVILQGIAPAGQPVNWNIEPPQILGVNQL